MRKNFAPPDFVRQPAVEYGAEHRAKPRRQENYGGFAERKLPRPGDKGHHVANQEVVEELEHVAEDRGSNDPALISRQLCLLLEVLKHLGVNSEE